MVSRPIGLVPYSRSSCTEGSIAEASLCPTDDKRTSVNRGQFSLASVGDEAAAVILISGSMSRQRLVDQGELDALPH